MTTAAKATPTTAAPAPVAAAVLDAVRAGRTTEVVRLLDGMTDPERRALFPALKELRGELRAARWSAEVRRAHPALHAAGAACQTGAVAVSSWLAASDMRWSQARPAVLIDILGDREPRWLADVVRRLAARPFTARVPYELMSGLARLSGAPIPTTDAYVRAWVDSVNRAGRRDDTLLDRLRAEPRLRELVAALFRTDGLGSWLDWPSGDGPDTWIGSLYRLVADGTLDRAATVDACVARLLRGGNLVDQRVFLRLLRELALTREEERGRISDWLALASDGPAPVAAHAQAVLGALALDGEVSPRHLTELTEAVLFRPERKLVRAQLVLLGKVLTRDPAAAGEVLPAVAQVFGHEDSDLQERALKLVERHLGEAAAPELRAGLAEAAGGLVPALRTRAARALGVTPAAQEPAGHTEVLPPVPRPVRLAPAPGSAVELAEEIGALLASGGDVATFERALDGLVRHAHRDREELLSALEPVISRRWWAGPRRFRDRHEVASSFERRHVPLDSGGGFDLLLATLTGAARIRRQPSPDTACPHGSLARPFEARLEEIARRLIDDPLPLLLATPSWGTGVLEPGELVDRLETCRRLGTRIAPVDFGQALLRVRRADRTAAGAAAERAAALGTEEGTRLAAWLTAPEGPLPRVTRLTHDTRVLVETEAATGLPDNLPEPLSLLRAPLGASLARGYCYHWYSGARQHWLGLLPEQPELVAARMLRDLSMAAVDDERGPCSILPRLVEAEGAAGESVHLCLAYGLGARHAEDRLAGVDALLVLAARGGLDHARLGADLGELVRSGAVKPLRAADALRTAAATGAHRTVWLVLRRALPGLLADLDASVPARGLGDLLAVAAECAERTGARGDLPHLARAADRRGASRLVTQARRLRHALTDGAPAGGARAEEVAAV
ncbi:DUF6493 family protein [Streptomyces sp. SCSIO 75703]|uniref:DUF6493 family protein n=1 Tax=unclassified Streptomyces TaxID=2593676 RepID=UPI0006B5A266|nr:DUF6493 family protein [Streptomyces sp. TP-A0875]